MGTAFLTTTTFRLGELFCGHGGLALGAISSKIKIQNSTWDIQLFPEDWVAME